MLIEYRKNYDIIYDYIFELKKHDSDDIDNLISESLGAFEQQYEISNNVASLAYKLLMNKESEGEITIENNIVKKIHLTIYLKTIWGVSASLTEISDDCMFLTINLPKNYIMLPREKFINALTDPISHELMHCNVFVKRYENNVIPDDRPSYYNDVISIIGDESCQDDIVYDFAYALYSTYYQEVAAMVSQSSRQFKNFLMGNELNNRNANIALKQCNSYMIYNNIINYTVPTISNMSDDEINNRIVKYFNGVGIDCDVNWVRKQLEKIHNVAKDALHNIIRNVSYDLYN